MRFHKSGILLMLLVLVFLFAGCGSARQARETALQNWLTTAKRPIQVVKHSPYQHFAATRGIHYYTLTDRDGNVFLAERVRFELPAVIE